MSNRQKSSIRRFSKIRTERQAPYFEFYSPAPDPVKKHEQQFRKKKASESGKKSKSAKEQKEIEEEQKKIEKYVAPIPRSVRKENEERHKKEKEMWYVCKKDVVRLPSPITIAQVPDKPVEFESPYKHESRKIIPTKISLTDSMNKWPPEPTVEELEEKIPKTGIFINRTRGKKKIEEIKKPVIDSYDYIYNETYRRGHPWYQMYRASTTIPPSPQDEKEGEEAEEDYVSRQYPSEVSGEYGAGDSKYEKEGSEFEYEEEIKTLVSDMQGSSKELIIPRRKSELLVTKKTSSEEMLEDVEGLEEAKSQVYPLESFTSQYRYSTSDIEIAPNAINKILQKYPDDPEVARRPSDRVLFKRGTINSHSTSKVHPKLKTFYFGIISGSMHLGDETFPPETRFKQSLAMMAVAYCYSFIKMPLTWNSRDIDRILIDGDKLYARSIKELPPGEPKGILRPHNLIDIVELYEKKIKFKIEEPDIAGKIKSDDPKVYDLVKGLKLFFQRNRAGILQSYETNILIWRQKQYFVFDAMPRTQELFFNKEGFACIANFYDLPSVIVMLIDRGYLENWPYIISRISVKKILGSTDPEVESTEELKCDSRYRIISQEKAIVSGTMTLGSYCFGETKNKQGLAVAIIAMLYSKITPSCAWNRKTVDKVLLLANAFYTECVEASSTGEMRLDNVPAFFTIGPLLAEIQIYVNQYAGMMFQNQECIFSRLLEKCFETNFHVIIQIDKYVVAVWCQRHMYYMFDPYSRDQEGLLCSDGTACITMNENIESIVKTILFNFNIPEYIFKIHLLKVIKLRHDPEMGKPGKVCTSEDNIIMTIKRRGIQNATEIKPIMIDTTENAIGELGEGESIHPSVIEIESTIGSLGKSYIPVCDSSGEDIKHKLESPGEKIYNLDSPSLSDTQIVKEPPSPLRADSFEFRLLEEIAKEEREISMLGNYEEGDYRDTHTDDFVANYMIHDMDQQNIERRMMYEKLSAEVNTKLMGLRPLRKEILEPSKVPRRSKKKSKPTEKKGFKSLEAITQSEELLKPSNFIALPDGAEILYGTMNVTNIAEDYEEVSPFVSIMATVMAKKYTLTTWTTEVIDAIVGSGAALKNSIEVRFSDAPKLKIPKVVVGSNTFMLTVDHIFDSLLEPTILRTCLEKLVFKDKEGAIIVTKIYSVAVFCKRFVYYMFDGFGNDLVGLGKGLDNSGIACMLRFRNLNALVSRFMYNKKQREKYEPTEAARFVLSSVEVKAVFADPPKPIPRRENQLYPPASDYKDDVGEGEEGEEQTKKEAYKEPKNKVGFYVNNRMRVLEGSDGLTDRLEGSGVLKMCYMVSACALIGLFNKSITSWDTKRVDYILISGKSLYDFVDDTKFSDSKFINGLLIDKHFYDIVIKRLNIANPRNAKSLAIALKFVTEKHKFLMLQLPSCCYAIYKRDDYLYLFDSYGVDPETPKACWIRFKSDRGMRSYMTKMNKDHIETFFFYTMQILRMRRASKKSQMQYKLDITNLKPKERSKKLNILHEHEDWLKVYPIPWSLMKKTVSSGVQRGAKLNFWYNWNIEYPNDLFSLFGTIHQTADIFPIKNRGRQTIANCIVAIVMTEVYEFTEWNSNVLDSILKSGDQYFTETFKSIKDKNYEIRIEDFKKELNVFLYKVNIDIIPLFEGTMFLIKADQFNLSKALRYFFEKHENRCGIICSYTGTSKVKFVAFGRIKKDEYFMYDCQTIGPPMFLDRLRSTSYVLRCLSLNRLLYILTLTLRNGDFFIYYVGLSEQQSEQVTGLTNYEQGADEEKYNNSVVLNENAGEENEAPEETTSPTEDDAAAPEQAET